MNSSFSEVRLSLGRCTLSPAFFDDFYVQFLESSPLIKERFENTDMTAQKALLRNGLSHLIKYSEGSKAADMKLHRLAESHNRSAMDIPAWMYEKWLEALLAAVKKHDAKISDDLLDHWKQALNKGIDYMVKQY